MVYKRAVSSLEEVTKYKRLGYALVALACVAENGKFTYFLEKGSEWSRLLGSR